MSEGPRKSIGAARGMQAGLKLGALFCLWFLSGCATIPPIQGANPIRLPAGISYRERLQTYRVAGTDRASIGQGILALPINGQRFAGSYKWNMAWRYQTRARDAICYMSQATVAIDATITLPEWSAPAGADPALVDDWKRYATALTSHEAGHRELVLTGAKRVQRALLDVSPQPCGSMQASARQAAQSQMEEIRKEDARYDQTTRHGATQGAVWSGITPWWQSQ
jgi:predicted secreted Zn-dependent protease